MKHIKIFSFFVLVFGLFLFRSPLVFGVDTSPYVCLTASPTSVDLNGNSLITINLTHDEACQLPLDPCALGPYWCPRCVIKSNGVVRDDLGGTDGLTWETQVPLQYNTLAQTNNDHEEVTCRNSEGSGTSRTSSIDIPIKHPVVQLDVTSPVDPGGTSSLHWHPVGYNNATSCYSPQFPNDTGTNVWVNSEALFTNTDFSVTCTGPGGSGSDEKMVYVTQDKPDLTVGAVSPTDITIPDGQNAVNAAFTATIMNLSQTVPTPNGFPYFFQIADDSIGTNAHDYPSSNIVDILSPTGTATATFNHVFTQGTYYIQACADKYDRNTNHTSNPPDQVIESNEDNNCSGFSEVHIIKSSSTLPDLTAYPALPYNAVAGLPVNFTANIYNRGGAATGQAGSKFWNFFQVQGGAASGGGGLMSEKSSNLFFGLFKRANAATGGGGSTNLDSDLPPVQMAMLAPGSSAITQQNYIFSAAGVYSVRACADKLNRLDAVGVVQEAINSGNPYGPNEDNNCGNWVTVNVAPGSSQLKPDLKPGLITPTTALVNVPTTFSVPISNIGAVSTGVGFTDLLELKTTDTSGHETISVFPKSEGALSAGLTYVLSISKTFSTIGNYDVKVCADKTSLNDANGVISESNELNNCTDWTTISVTNKQNSIGVNLSADSTTVLLPNDTVNLTWTTSGSPDSCVASNSPQNLWTGSKNQLGGTEQVAGLNAGTYVFTITCQKGNLPSVDSTVVVNVQQNSNATMDVTLTTDKTSINVGDYVKLEWVTVGNPDSCTATSTPTTSWAGHKTTAPGSEKVDGFGVPGVYVLKITCQKGTATKESSVAIGVGETGNVLCSPIHFGCFSSVLVPDSGTGSPTLGWTWQCKATGKVTGTGTVGKTGGNDETIVKCSQDANECHNGATNFPACDNNECHNGAINFPDCNLCGNGAINPPQCTAGSGGKCVDPKALNFNKALPCKYKIVPKYIER